MPGIARPPIIAITCNVLAPDPDRALYGGKELHYLERATSEAVLRAGGAPFLVPILDDPALLGGLFAHADGLLISSGLDLSPHLYGGPAPGEHPFAVETEERDRLELRLIREASARGLPILGLCRGAQAINLAFGGSLILDLPAEPLPHRDQEIYDENRHAIAIAPGTRLESILGSGPRSVCSVHHQAVDRVGEGLVVNARAPDGVIEGLEREGPGYLIGVQWHPEWTPEEEGTRRLLESFVEAARASADLSRDRRAAGWSGARSAS